MEMRITGMMAALLLGGGLPLFLLGPVLFQQMPLSVISTAALLTSIGFGIFGVWLFVVSCVAPMEELKKVLEPFEASEAVVFFLPYMLLVGTRTIWRGVRRKRTYEEP
jgi:hypothetical protein